MKIGLIDVDGHNYPNLALMKISAWHKAEHHHVEWCDELSHYDVVFMSKVFDFSPDYTHSPSATTSAIISSFPIKTPKSDKNPIIATLYISVYYIYFIIIIIISIRKRKKCIEKY